MTLRLRKVVVKPLQKLAYLMLLMFSIPAFSLSVDGLYSAQVEIEDQSVAQVLRAKKLGLAQVIVKVTGQSQSLNKSRIRVALTNAEAYLQRFSFNTTELPNGQSQALLELAFDKQLVDQLVAESGLPIWGTDRAAVLVWLVEDKQGTRKIINDNSHPMVAQIMAQANQRGMPLLWPLLDLEDQLTINPGALWGVFRGPIKRASGRYQADAILVGRVFQDSQQLWSVEWNFWLDQVEQKWSSQGADLATLVDPLQERVSASLVAKFALSTELNSPVDKVSKSVLLQVDQVTQIDDYAELLSMLQTIAGIDRVQLHSANGTSLKFRLFAQSNLGQIKSVIDLKRRLQAVQSQTSAPSGDSSDGLLWHYFWQ